MPARPSTHPADELIRRFIVSKDEQPSDTELESIIHRMGTAPFNSRMQRVPTRLRVRFRGHLLGPRADALLLHLIKRIVEDEQWAPGTTADEYLQDVHSAIRAEDARLVIFKTWGGSFAATITATDAAVPAGRRGAKAERLLFSLYSADAAIIVTAYMISTLDTLRLPEDVRWLR